MWTGHRGLPVVTTAILLAMVSTACTSDEPESGPEPSPPTPSPTRWGPELTYEQAYEQIPLDGTDQTPLHWTLPELDDAGLEAAMLAARRFLALSYYEWSLPAPETDSHLFQYVATESEFRLLYPDGPEPGNQTDPTAGPVWIRVYDVERMSPTLVHLSMCRDDRWFDLFDEELPRANGGLAARYEVELVPTLVEDSRWLVDRETLFGTSDSDTQKCKDWANHTP